MYRILISPVIFLSLTMPFFAALPSTSNYSLNSYGFGSGGGATSTSNYSLQGITGESSGSTPATATYTTKPGFIQDEQANTPKVTLTNPSSFYDKLKFVIDTQNNPTDALYGLQVKVNDATCDFTTGTIRYVQTDDTLSTSNTISSYQTYTAWGGASGQNMIGLASNTTYCVRATATQGKYTESGYGPSSSAATVGQQISFCLYTNANCGAGGSSIALGGLTAGSITTSSSSISVDFATNADFGGNVYIYSLNGGLKSTSASYTMSSATADLAVVSEGFGAQITSIGQTTGGPLSKVSPFDGSSNNVGVLATTIATIFSSSNPLTGGTGSIQLQAKPANATPEANDYAETLTLIAAATF